MLNLIRLNDENLRECCVENVISIELENIICYECNNSKLLYTCNSLEGMYTYTLLSETMYYDIFKLADKVYLCSPCSKTCEYFDLCMLVHGEQCDAIVEKFKHSNNVEEIKL